MDSPFNNLGDASTFLARAELMFELDRYDEARDELGGALSHDPAHVSSLTLLAILELQVENYEEALAAAEAAIAAEPTHEPAVLARGHALALLHRTEAALAAADDIQQRYPESWWHNIHYALIVREARNGQDALDAAWAAVKLAPEEGRAHLALALVAAALRLDDLADRALTAAARCEPGIETLLTGEPGPTLLRGSPDKPVNQRIVARDGWEHAPARKRAHWPQQVQRLLSIAGAVAILVPVAAAVISGGQPGVAQLIAGIGAIAGVIALVVMVTRLPANLKDRTRVLVDQDKLLGLAVITAGCGPLLAGVFAATGLIYLLGFAVFAGIATVGLATLRNRFLAGYKMAGLSAGHSRVIPGRCIRW